MRRKILIFAGVVAATLLGGLAWQRHSQLSLQPSIRVGYMPIYPDLPLFVGVEKGFFRKRKMEIELIRFESSPLMGTALVNGDVDAVASIASSTAFTIESRDPSRFKVFIVDAENPTGYLSALVAMPNSEITEVTDLKGKRVGIFPGPTAGTFYRILFRKHGLDPDNDLTILELAPGTHVETLVSGQVDALATYEPLATQAVVQHGAVKVLPGAIERGVINPWQAGSWLISTRLLEEDPRAARAFIEACYEAVDYMREHPEESKTHLRGYTGIDQEVASQTPTIPFTKIGEVDLQAYQEHADMLQQAGVLSKSIPTAELLLDSLPQSE
jgi:NitT/TauT family transport system substrate-binding protein